MRARLQNSQPLLEGTNLALFTINETTLSQWFKKSTRRNEVKLLLQGLSSTPSQSTAHQPLLPASSRPQPPLPPPRTPHIFPQAEDRIALAHPAPETRDPQALDPLLLPPSDSSTPVSRTTEWRRRKSAAEDAPPRKRKEYSCRICGTPISGGKQLRS